MLFSSSIRSGKENKEMGLYRKKGTSNWWMNFTIDGIQYNKSTGTADAKLAGLIPADMELKVLKNEKLGMEFELGYILDEMMSKFMSDYAPKQEKSTQRRYEQSLKHLLPFFGGRKL
jgi:hypothetical protein